jgi:hypothetical protein
VPLWFDGGGPTKFRGKAAEYDAEKVEPARVHFAYVFGLEVQAVEIGIAADAADRRELPR